MKRFFHELAITCRMALQIVFQGNARGSFFGVLSLSWRVSLLPHGECGTQEDDQREHGFLHNVILFPKEMILPARSACCSKEAGYFPDESFGDLMSSAGVYEHWLKRVLINS
jgi:hypothetical protein